MEEMRAQKSRNFESKTKGQTVLAVTVSKCEGWFGGRVAVIGQVEVWRTCEGGWGREVGDYEISDTVWPDTEKLSSCKSAVGIIVVIKQ